MAGFKGVADDDDDVLAKINMVPMIDVVLVLLIIFIVTASAIVKAAIAVDLPKASTSESTTKPPLSIILSCEEKQASDAQTASRSCTPGPILVDGDPIVDMSDPDATVDPLIARIRQELAELKRAAVAAGDSPDDAELNVLITADKDIRFQNVIWLMDVLKNERVDGVMFNSELFTRPGDARRLPR